MEDSFSMDQGGVGEWFQDVSSTLHLLCTLSCYYCISSTSDHQALDPRVWGPLTRSLLGMQILSPSLEVLNQKLQGRAQEPVFSQAFQLPLMLTSV